MSFLLALVLVAAPLCPHPARNPGIIRKWVQLHPCPSSCALYKKTDNGFKLWRACGGCQVDHICPLACCGADSGSNLQWLTAEQNRAKSADCRACRR